MVISSDVAFSCLGSESKKLGEKFIVWHSFYLKESGSLEPNFNDDKLDKLNYYSSGAEDSWSCHFRSCPFLCFLCLLFMIFYHCTCVCVIFISIKVGGSGTCGLHFFFLASPPLWLQREHWWDIKKDLFNSKQIIFNVFRDVFHGQNFKKGIICYWHLWCQAHLLPFKQRQLCEKCFDFINIWRTVYLQVCPSTSSLDKDRFEHICLYSRQFLCSKLS